VRINTKQQVQQAMILCVCSRIQASCQETFCAQGEKWDDYFWVFHEEGVMLVKGVIPY
jgi:hypothetical protein